MIGLYQAQTRIRSAWPPNPGLKGRDILRLECRILLSVGGPVPPGTPEVYFYRDAAGGYPPLEPEWIIKATARAWHCHAHEIIGQRRFKSLVAARWHAAALIRHNCPHLSLPEIGRAMGGRCHTSIMHGLRRFDELARQESVEGE
ncbi:MAG: hypothetical protein C0605_07775 [Hyphomicrobiales bacterium]|nr:MAG: hypothetical protein C0605_07775 [Hyphomicrobiales bacterium]